MTEMITEFTNTSIYIIERDFYGEFDTLHVLILIEDVSK